MTATVTILGRATDAHGRRAVLAKRWTRQPPGSGEAQQGAPRWTEQPYDRAYRYDARVESVAHIGELAELLARLAHDRHACVVRGELTGKRVGIRRRHKRRQGDKEADVPPLREAPTAVLALDLDHVPLPEHVDPRVDLDGCVEAGMALLPEAFHEVACAVQFTGGHGMPGKPGARMRLWVMLSRPMGGTEIRRWLRPEIDAGKIDGALYSASQPHYTAAPIFDSFDGTALPDHLAKRVLLRRGFTDEVQAPAEEELKPQRECGNYKAGPGEFTGGFEAIIARIGDHEGGAGYFRPINAAVGRWIRDNGHDADPKPLKAQLAGIITERGERDGRPQEYVQKRIADLDTLVEYVQQAERAKIDGTPCEPHWKAPARDNAATLARMASSMQQFFYNAARRATARQAFDAAKQEIEIAVGEMPEGGRWARRELRRRGREIRAEHGPWRTPGDRLQVVGAAGCGKTATAISLVVTTGATLGLVWICLPTWAEATRVTEEIIARGGGAISYRGRGAPKHGTNPVDSDLMCERPAAAKALGEAGMAVSKHLCKNPDTGESCPHFSTCAWQSQRLRADAIVKRGRGVIVGTFEMLAGNMGLGSPDLVVVDERAWDRLVGEVTLSVADMLPGMMAWRRRGKRGGDKLGQALDVRRELGAIRDAVTAGSGKILCELRARGFTSKQSFADTLEWLHGTEEEAAASITPGMADDDIAEQAKALQRSPWPAVHRLVRSLAAEIELPRDICHAVHTRQGENDPLAGHAVVHYVPRLGGIAERTPVLLLDASADLTINRRLFGERLHQIEARLERNAVVVQVVDKVFSKSSLLGSGKKGAPISGTSIEAAKGLRAELIEVVRGIAHKHGRTAWFATKPVEAVLELEGLDKADTPHGHFGAIRGSNAWEGCAVGVIIGREQPPPAAVEGYARALWATDPAALRLGGGYIRQVRGRRIGDGTGRSAEVDCHADGRVQAVLEQFRERENEQALDRLRLIHANEPKLICLVGNLVLDVTVARIVTRRELVAETTGQTDNAKAGPGRRLNVNRLAEAFRRAGALPLSRSELARCFPDLWASERAARDDLAKWADSANNIFFGESAYLTVSYRRRSQAGKATRALVRAGAGWRATLEALVGPVVEVPLVQGEVPPPADGSPEAAKPAWHRAPSGIGGCACGQPKSEPASLG